VLLAIAIPLGAAALYQALTNYPWDNPQSAEAAPTAAHGEGTGELSEAAKMLEARLKQNPADAEGWRMLGRTYLVTGAPDKAVAAYEEANRLTGGTDAGLQLDIAEAMVLSEVPEQQERAREILSAALKANPNEAKALWYTGVMAVRAGDTATARTSYQKLLEQNPPPDIRQIVVDQLAALGVETPGAAGATPPGMGGGTSTAAAAGPTEGRTVSIAVSVSPALAAQMKPGTPLFVSARQPGIPGPPLAAVRLSADQLPTTVVLSDANSMVEGRNLSSVDDLEIVARVAFGGTAVPAKGDLVGTVTSAKGGPADVSIVIDKVAP
jgi:cytochrome c-type biogenesis protein CcmH